MNERTNVFILSSTNAFDKNPQSQERGITLDLGFSSFTMDMPEHLTTTHFKQLQITLVDCPGHASLIRTIIGGKHIVILDLVPNSTRIVDVLVV
jgi:selenocysteine-specific elongation factor